jgi:hypothetical protein
MNIDAVIISPLLCERQKASSSSTLGRHVFTYTTHVSQVFDYYLFDCFHYFSCFQWKTPSFFQYEPVIFILTHFFPLCCQPTWNPLIELCLSLWLKSEACMSPSKKDVRSKGIHSWSTVILISFHVLLLLLLLLLLYQFVSVGTRFSWHIPHILT